MIDRWDDYEYEDFEDDLKPLHPPGPLSKFPSGQHLWPAVICLILFYLASTVHAGHQYGRLLPVSGASIFQDNEYWRLFTALFVHGSLLHLLSNAFMFVVFGWLLRAYFGFITFPVISFLMGIVSNLATVAFYKPEIQLVGASGMIYAMAALWLVFYMKYDTERRLSVRIFRAAGFVMIMLVPSTFEPQVSYLAHAMGFAAGIVTGLLVLPVIKVRDPG